MVTSAPETPTVTPQEPARSIASTIRATTWKPTSEHRQSRFSQMQQDEKIDFLFSQLQAAAGQIDRQSTVINWYNSRNTKITDGVKQITKGFEFVRNRVNILWGDRCKQQEVLKKRDHDSEDSGNPDPPATSEQPPTTTSTQIVIFKPSHLGSAQGTSSGIIEEIQQLESSSYIESSLPGTSSVLSSADFALQALHPVTGEVLKEGEFVADLSNEQMLALNEMKTKLYTENIDEIVFEGETSKSTYVRADGMEFDPFDEEWMKENQENIDE
ncbi:hypothetical protein Hanom_Chr04g00298381 [Helianthus anomalus]